MKRKLLMGLLVFSLIALIVSVIILIENISHSSALQDICTATGSTCSEVQNSEYGKVLGVKMVYMGLAAFILFTLIVLSLLFNNKISKKSWLKHKHIEFLMISGAIIAGISGIYLISLQAFVLHQYCTYCLIIDTSSIIIMFLAILYVLKR